MLDHSNSKRAARWAMIGLLVMLGGPTLWCLPGEEVYAEKYRPMFHFSPRTGWIGDPDGLIRSGATYHLFWWGHAESADLVHWKEQPYPMVGDDGTFNYFSGSVVLDRTNTSGLGENGSPPLLAIYTAHGRVGGFEDQRMSVSHDQHYFRYYHGNPVLSEPGVPLRDPDVFWHAASRKWIMLLVAPEQHKIRFYRSDNLTSWEFASEFGGIGAQGGNWEVPNLFQLPVHGQTNAQKWVLTCGVGPNRMQYFTGSFDGTQFTLDPDVRAYLSNGTGLDGEVYADFESGKWEPWVAEGDAFGDAPAVGKGAMPGTLGSGLARSNGQGESKTGHLTSPKFTIHQRAINFLIGGGRDAAQTGIQLLVDGQVVRAAAGKDDDVLRWGGWNVAEFMGREAVVRITDVAASGRWGHIEVDQVLFSDVVLDTNAEHANWADYGADFYAARGLRDYDNGGRVLAWMGWMGNWTYARSVPTTWGKGAESLPRTLELRPSPLGARLVQRPWSGLQALRGQAVTVDSRHFTATTPLGEFQPHRNAYEMETTFDLDSPDQDIGLNLCVGGKDKVVLGYNARNANVYLDRRASGNVAFHPRFPQITVAPYTVKNGRITFHVFVDQSSVEVFVDDGELVFTSLIFPDPAAVGVELFSRNGGATLQHLSAWELASIWN